MGGRLVAITATLGCVFFAPAGAAQARDFNCDASALRLQFANQAIVEPITANRGAPSCTDTSSVTSASSGPVAAGVLLAETKTPSGTEASARGGLAYLSIGQGALAGIPLPTLDAVDQLPAVPVPIPAGGQLLGLPAQITVDIRPAVRSLVAGITTAPLLEVAGSVATAEASCQGSTPKLSGHTDVAAVKVLGQSLPTDAVVNQPLALYNGQTIDPSKLDLTQVVLPPGLSFTDPAVGTILKDAVGPVLAALPAITLPESLLQISLIPSDQQTADGGLTQTGLRIALGVLGQNVVRALIGEARISVDSVRCVVQTTKGEVAPITAVPEQALECSTRRLALIDVLDRGRYVTLYGAADKRYAGRRVAIRSKADGRVVARPRVSKAGLFRARAPLPPERWRRSNRARYTAVIGNQRSLALKLHRRMYFTSIRSAHGRLVLRGVVTKPHTRPRDTVVIRQRLTCRKQRVVARVRPDADGRFTVRLKVPRKGDVGVYRGTTMVGYPDGPDFRTYTLPGLVRFAR